MLRMAVKQKSVRYWTDYRKKKQEKQYVFFCARRGEGCVSSEVDRGAGIEFVVAFQEM